jgi:hypothetical protein
MTSVRVRSSPTFRPATLARLSLLEAKIGYFSQEIERRGA